MSEVNQRFFAENREDLAPLFKKENVKRAKRNIPPLTPPEIDAALEDIRALVSSGNRIRQYTFPETQGSIEPDPEQTQEPQFQKQKSLKPQKQVNQIGGDCYNFQVNKLKNGFVITSELGPFIFKDETELLGILKDTLFKHFDKKKEEPEIKRRKRRKKANLQSVKKETENVIDAETSSARSA